MSRGFAYGGQAVIDGVMMRGRRNITVAVRRPNGQIALHIKPLQTLPFENLRRFPLLRGVILLAETLILAVQILLFSANLSLEEEEKISSPMVWSILVISLVLILGLFFIVPLLLLETGWFSFSSTIVRNLTEGFLRLVIFLLYLWGMSLLPEARKVFAYHGAEHKVINAYEHGAPLEIDAVRRFSTAHARCGTTFLFNIFVLAILLFAFLGNPGVGWSILLRLLSIPLVAALSFEITRYSITHHRSPMVRLFLVPGLALQSMTTRKPSDAQVEVALSALTGVMAADRGEKSSSETPPPLSPSPS